MDKHAEVIKNISAESERIREDCEYSSKSHFEAARRWGKVHLALGVPAALLSAIAGVTALSDYPEYAAAIAFLVAGIAGGATFLNPEKRAASHHGAATQYLSLKNRARIFLTIELLQMDESLNDATEALRALTQTRDELNKVSPAIPRWAYLNAKVGIETGEAEHAVDVPE